MKIVLSDSAARFEEGSAVAGVCVLDDPYKPYLCPLNTPRGHNTTRTMPTDHRHHKGVMYALRCADLNFWEEPAGQPDCGLQRVESVEDSGGALKLELLWEREGGGWETYRETRILECASVPGKRAFVWKWQSRREALRDHQLIQSEGSKPAEDGRLINYHGLGFRAPREWAMPKERFFGLSMDGRPASAAEAHGSRAREITFRGMLDGYWTPPTVSVTLRQAHGYGWFVLREPFVYLATGPSCFEPIQVSKGAIFEETFEIEVADV